MTQASLSNNLDCVKQTPSRCYHERVIKHFSNITNFDSIEARGECIGKCRLPTTISPCDVHKLQNELIPRPTDVFVVTYPKSGTTWMQQIVKLIWNNGIEDGRDIDEALPWIDPMTPAEAEAMPSPRGFKVHLPYHLTPGGDPASSPAKYIYVYRNPKDALVSSYHFSMKFFPEDIPWNEYFNICVGDQQYYGTIFDHVQEWYLHKGSPNILLISYERLKKSTSSVINEIGSFLGYGLTDDAIARIATQVSFDRMKSNPTCNNSFFDKYRRPGDAFMRKGTVGDWKSLFSQDQSALVDQQVAEKLSPLGLVYEYN